MNKGEIIEGKSIGEAYINALNFIKEKKGHGYLIVHISQPIRESGREVQIEEIENRGCEIRDWLDVVNVEDSVFNAFCRYEFPKPDAWSGRNTGEDWINGRIKDLLHPEGNYYKALRERFDQLECVEKRLRARDERGRKMHGGATNALVCQVYMPEEDLKSVCDSPRPNVQRIRCLTMIDFKPEKDFLNMMAVFRSQYFDTKAYGNFIALAILLYKMSVKTGYEPGAIVSIANKVTYQFDINKLYACLTDRNDMNR